MQKANKEFANKGKFHNYLINIANQFGKGDYDVHGFSVVLKFNPLPDYTILKSGSPFFIRFNFKEDMRVYLSLTDSYQNVETMQKGIIFDKFDEKHLEYIKRVTDAKIK